MADPVHILVYVKRRLGNGRGTPRRRGTFNQSSLVQPAGHGFGQPWLFKLHQKHPLVIWLFSIVRYGDVCLPPALDSRIEVAAPAHGSSESWPEQSRSDYREWLLCKYRYAFEAEADKSFYLPWNHFTPELSGLFPDTTLDTVEPEVVAFERYSEFVTHFQTPRLLPTGGADALERFAGQVRLMPRGIVSYRRTEAPVLAMQVAARLFRSGIAPWWDQWAMPRTVAEETAMLEDADALSEAIDQAIRKAQYAVTIHTRSYGTAASPYTKFEFDRINAAAQADSLALLQLHAADKMSSCKGSVDDALRVAGLGRRQQTTTSKLE